ncbi:MAG: ComEC/Rec2 family competence protein [Notoacmeibacter sp.]|nr:ComEC/Rec2 family competence protein [Notoacmeibacter sp.]
MSALATGWVLLAFCLVLARRHHTRFLVFGAALTMLSGAVTAKVTSDLRPATVLGSPVTTTVTGTVLEAEAISGKRDRVVIRVQATDKPKLRHAPPQRIRVSLPRSDPPLAPGETIKVRVNLSPPGGPVRPGGYDFSFQAWFTGIDATGYARKAQESREPPVGLNVPAAMEGGRDWLTNRIRTQVGGPEGAIAAALVTGRKALIDGEAEEALRTAGLAHILSISGLHMALVAGTIAGVLRAGFALFPLFTSRHAVRKWCAAAALVAAAAYLFISGGAVATQRSFIMLAVMLLALLFDRAALTMRNLATAAMIVVMIAPAEVGGAGFQMSFAATAALVAAYAQVQDWQLKRSRTPGNSVAVRVVRSVLALAFTALIAGTATGIFAAYHFQRVAPLGMAGNLAAMPIVTLVIMPSAVAAHLMIPLDLDRPFFWIMGKGIAAVVWIATRVQEATGRDMTGPVPRDAMLLAALALIMLTGFTSRLRLLALPVIAAAGLAFIMRDLPDMLVSEDAKLVAVRVSSGTVAVTARSRKGFVLENWERLWPGAELVTARKADDKAVEALLNGKQGHSPDKTKINVPTEKGERFLCSRTLCAVKTDAGIIVAWAQGKEALETACGHAALIVVADASAPRGCTAGVETKTPTVPKPRPTIIHARELGLRGSAEIRFGTESLLEPVMHHALDETLRPWHAHRIHGRAARGLAPWRPKNQKK